MISWLAFSEHERDRAQDLVQRLREREARDELGLGTIRDTLSDLLFPGTSTLHTRARYFLFIPRIYSALESRRLSPLDLQTRGRKAELKLCDALLQSGETDGVIGRVAKRDLKRLASSIYWNGLRTWRVLRVPIAQTEYFRRASGAGRRASLIPDGDATELARTVFWDSSLPPGDDGQDGETTFDLTEDEATYLASKIREHHGDSLLAQLIDRTRPSLPESAPWLWLAPSALPAARRRELEHAQVFSELVFSATLVYNLVLAEASKKKDRIDLYRRELALQRDSLITRASTLEAWDIGDFWALVDHARSSSPSEAPISITARAFCTSWFEFMRAHLDADLTRNERARQLVSDRERALKGPYSRVAGGRALDLWQGASGFGRLNFRWNQVRRVMTDIRHGLGYDDA